MLTILVTGATGNVGRPLVAELATLDVEVRAVTQQPVGAGLPLGVTRHGSVSDALPGCDAVFLNSRALGPELETTVAAARAAGVRRLVALSAINVDEDFSRQPSRVRGDRNREAEEFAATSGLEWTSLRPSVFASNFAGMWAEQLRVGNEIAGPYAAASVAVIADADVSAVAVRALVSNDLLGQRIPLTGPQSLTNAELVETIGAALGRQLAYRELPPEAVRRRFVALGFPPAFADAYVALLAETVGRTATVTDDVRRVLGRSATPFSRWAATHRHLFTN